MLVLEWAGPGSCETRFSWFAIDYPGRLPAIEGADAARQLLAAEMLPGQAGKTFPVSGGFWEQAPGDCHWKNGGEESPVGFLKQRKKRNHIISVTFEKQGKTSG